MDVRIEGCENICVGFVKRRGLSEEEAHCWIWCHRECKRNCSVFVKTGMISCCSASSFVQAVAWTL